MSFVGGAGVINCDLLFSGLPRLPKEGEEIFAEDFALRMGGGVPAVMVNLSRLNVPSRLCTYLGTDIFSGFARSELQSSNVRCENLFEGEGIPLVVTAVSITPGDRTFTSGKAAPTRIKNLAERVYQAFHGASVVRMSGDIRLRDVFKQLKNEGATLVYDTGWDEEMTLEKYAPVLRLADYYLPNRPEALKITGQSDIRAAAKRLGELYEHVVVKLDAQGCYLLDNGRETCLDSLKGVAAVDSTGAGDAFCAGFMYGLYHRFNFADCARLGAVMGGLCVTRVGCLERRVREEELLELYPTIAARPVSL